MELRAQAKINLFLIVKKFNKKLQLHKIDSVIKKINSTYDVIEINRNESDKDKIRYFSSNGQLLKIENCIVNRTLSLFREKKIINYFYNVDIYKNIPVGSGLGGGSSDAAEIIKFILNDNNKKITKNIINLSLSLGSDIPFFLYDYDLAFISGYGEKVKKINTNQVIDIELATSNIQCSSKEVYEKYKTLIKNEKTKTKEQLKHLKNSNFNLLKNDLQNACFILYPEVREWYKSLNENVDGKFKYKLSGSGSAFFKVIK